MTVRELQTLALVAEGKPYGVIAEHLHVSYKTVANTCTQLKAKLGVRTLPELMRIAIQHLPSATARPPNDVAPLRRLIGGRRPARGLPALSNRRIANQSLCASGSARARRTDLRQSDAPRAMNFQPHFRRALHNFDRSLSMIARHDQCMKPMLGRFGFNGKFSLAKRTHLANMGGQLGKERAAFWQGVFNNPRDALCARLRFLVRCH
jgi:DNA-binding CsgD family transcriptional regulator